MEDRERGRKKERERVRESERERERARERARERERDKEREKVIHFLALMAKVFSKRGRKVFDHHGGDYMHFRGFLPSSRL